MNPDVQFGGVLFGHERPAGVACRVIPTRDRLEAFAEAGLMAALPYADAAISIVGVDDRYVSFSGSVGENEIRILVADKTILARLEAIGMTRDVLDRVRAARAVGGRRRARKIAAIGVIAAAFGLVVIAAWLCFRWAVAKAVSVVPVAWEQEIGRAAASEILAQDMVCSDPRMNAAVREIGRRLVAGVGASPYAWKVRILDSPEVNAFALPGGYLFVNRGLIERAADGHEVAGVLAHEMEHVLERHGIVNLVREIGLKVVLYAVVGDTSAIERLAAANAAGLASMSFSRDQEREADALGLELVRRAKLDPSGLERLMVVLAADEGAIGSAMSFVSTHPASAERSEALAELRRPWGTPVVAPLASDWSASKGPCAPIRIADPNAD
jgi:beta-barrel assembly-enhancing protease